MTTERPAPLLERRSWRRGARVLPRPDDPTVVVWPDTFTDAYRPDAGAELVDLLERLGERVVVPGDWACCGRTLYDPGMLSLAKRTLTHLLDVLEPWTSRGIPVVVPEPSCLASFRDELPGLLPDDPRAAVLAGLSRSPAEQILASPGFTVLTNTGGARPKVVVHPHCHARAGRSTAADREVLEAVGFDTTVLDAGCCGLAGSFGFDAEKEGLSRRIGEESWLPKVRAAMSGDAIFVVDGFSCRTQLDQLGGPEPVTLVSLVRAFLGARATAR